MAAVHLRVNVLNEMQYRSNFFLQIFQTVLMTTNGVLIVALVSTAYLLSLAVILATRQYFGNQVFDAWAWRVSAPSAGGSAPAAGPP